MYVGEQVGELCIHTHFGWQHGACHPGRVASTTRQEAGGEKKGVPRKRTIYLFMCQEHNRELTSLVRRYVQRRWNSGTNEKLIGLGTVRQSCIGHAWKCRAESPCLHALFCSMPLSAAQEQMMVYEEREHRYSQPDLILCVSYNTFFEVYSVLWTRT